MYNPVIAIKPFIFSASPFIKTYCVRKTFLKHLSDIILLSAVKTPCRMFGKDHKMASREGESMGGVNRLHQKMR